MRVKPSQNPPPKLAVGLQTGLSRKLPILELQFPNPQSFLLKFPGRPIAIHVQNALTQADIYDAYYCHELMELLA